MDRRTGELYPSKLAALMAGVPKQYLKEIDSSQLLPRQREKMKVGRNEPCPCGSGKKFKKCCLMKAKEEMRHARGT